MSPWDGHTIHNSCMQSRLMWMTIFLMQTILRLHISSRNYMLLICYPNFQSFTLVDIRGDCFISKSHMVKKLQVNVSARRN